MNKTFQNLSKDKKERIIEVCMREFGEHGYVNASTNRIVDELGISKGSLFKYFGTKEELYVHIISLVLDEVIQVMEDIVLTENSPKDIIERMKYFFKKVFDYYIERPVKYKLVMTLINNTGDNFLEKIMQKFIEPAYKIFGQLFANTDTEALRTNPQAAGLLIKLIFIGIKMTYILPGTNDLDVLALKNTFYNDLVFALDALKSGLYKKPE